MFPLHAGHCEAVPVMVVPFLLLVLFVPLGSAQMPTGDPAILPPGARLEPLFEEAFFTEGPAVAPDGMVYFSDITMTVTAGMQAGHIWRYNPQTGECRVFRSPSGQANGIAFDAQGRMVVCEGADFGGRRVTRTDMTTGKGAIIAGVFDGMPFNAPNDVTIDERGRIYFSDPRYNGTEPVELPVMAVYRIDPDGTIHRIITDAGKPNGVAVSPDQRTLYVVSNDNGSLDENRMPATPVLKGRMALLAYDLKADGSASFRRVLVDYAPQDGPDGLEVDVEGNLYVAVRDKTRPGIYVYSPEGRELAYVPTKDLPTNVGFGRGADSSLLYVTAGKGLYRIRMAKAGYHLPAQR